MTALSEAVQLTLRQRMRTLAGAVMTGGWRLPFDVALGAMLNRLRSLAPPDSPLSVVIRVLSKNELTTGAEIAASKGVPLLGSPPLGQTPR